MIEYCTFKHRDRVFVDMPGFSGQGFVIGVQSRYPVIGYIYIIEFNNLPNKEYPYSALCIPEGAISLASP